MSLSCSSEGKSSPDSTSIGVGVGDDDAETILGELPGAQCLTDDGVGMVMSSSWPCLGAEWAGFLERILWDAVGVEGSGGVTGDERAGVG